MECLTKKTFPRHMMLKTKQGQILLAQRPSNERTHIQLYLSLISLTFYTFLCAPIDTLSNNLLLQNLQKNPKKIIIAPLKYHNALPDKKRLQKWLPGQFFVHTALNMIHKFVRCFKCIKRFLCTKNPDEKKLSKIYDCS